MRRALFAATAMSLVGVGSALLDYGLAHGLLWQGAGRGIDAEAARLVSLAVDAAWPPRATEMQKSAVRIAQAEADGLATDRRADVLASDTPDGQAHALAAEVDDHQAEDDILPHQIFTASMTAADGQFTEVEPLPHLDVNRHLKGDRLVLELAVAKLSLPEPEALEEGASAALFLLSPGLAEALATHTPAPVAEVTVMAAAAALPVNDASESAASATTIAEPAEGAPATAARIAMTTGPLASGPRVQAMQPPTRNPFLAPAATPTASTAPGVPATKISWNDLIRMAGMKGGDGEEAPRIFGALSEREFRAREVRCMATAIYFEARGEAIRGQIAVGQVIMNRVRSDFYPNTICGVVFQGQWNRNACQFSFACDGQTDAPKETEQWKTALDVAKQVIAGKTYLADIAEATHYHAFYVRPDWRRDVTRIKQIGVHIFYRAPFVKPLALNPDYQPL